MEDGHIIVLVASHHDDSPELSRMLGNLAGHVVNTVSDARAAFGSLRAMKRPCLVLLDLLMPQMDGIAVIEALKADETLASVPVVLLSGDRQRAADMRTPVLLKPVNLEAVQRVIQQHCGACDRS